MDSDTSDGTGAREAWTAEGDPGAAPGQAIGPYTLARVLGRGGMGTVWLARRSDGAYERDVALKLPHVHLLASGVQLRFRRERDILAGLTHPHIAQFLDAGVAGGRPYLALEHVPGRPLTEHCRERGVDLAGRLRLFRQVTAAVDYAHGRLVVHRDLKPSNVMVTAAGQVKLLDFGIAKLLAEDDDSATALTVEGSRVATPDYAAPEQLTGDTITVATDVYALGVVLFELLTGVLPYASVRGPAQWDPERRGEAPLASTRVDPEHAPTVGGLGARGLARALAGDMDAILARALAAAPAERYGSVEALAADLQRFGLHEPVHARRISRAQRLRKFVRRHRLGVGLGTLVVLATAAGVAGILLQARETARAARRAEATKEFLLGVFRASDPRVTQDRPRGEITARELLDTAAAQLETRLKDEPETRSELLMQVATIYTYLDEPDAARRFAARARAGMLDHMPAGDPRLLGLLLFEVWLALAGPDPEHAAPLLADLDQRLAAHGLDGSVLRAEWHLAASDLHAARGAHAARERSLHDAVAAYENAAPRDSGHEATLSNLGQITFARGELERAREILDRALAVALTASSDVGTDLARIQTRRGRVLLELDRLGDAKAALDDALARYARTVGVAHVTAWPAHAARARLAARERDLGRFEQGRAELMRMPRFDHESNRTRRAEAELLIGLALVDLGRGPEAAPILNGAVATLSGQQDFAGDVARARRALESLGSAPR